MMNNKVSFTNSNNPTISLSAVIYFPQNLMKPVSIRQLWYLTRGALKSKRLEPMPKNWRKRICHYCL